MGLYKQNGGGSGGADNRGGVDCLAVRALPLRVMRQRRVFRAGGLWGKNCVSGRASLSANDKGVRTQGGAQKCEAENSYAGFVVSICAIPRCDAVGTAEPSTYAQSKSPGMPHR